MGGQQNKSSIFVPVLTNFGPNTDAKIYKITPPPYNPAVKSDTSVNSSIVSHSLYPDLRALTTLWWTTIWTHMFTDPSETNSSLTAPPLQQRPPDLQLQNQPHLQPRSNSSH
ncbi:hypothetical protein GOODEAATRI_033200 [Goodea atripinnis]|uniref:Uncharacterized protein n=1 Tax=Goodea atripinnis TaxID=208336 RepID=A0ABV0NG09_9TELE